jgi:glycosyltransferase involved in cell wall biosynthesis
VKILHCARHLTSAGGVEAYLHRLVKAQAEAGHDLVLMGGISHSRDMFPEGLRVEIVTGYDRFGSPREATAQALKIVNSVAPDLVHIHAIDNYDFALRASQERPVIKHSHIDFSCATGGRRYMGTARAPCERTTSLRCLWHYYASRCGPGVNPLWAFWSYRRSVAALRTWPKMQLVLANSEWLRDSLEAAGLPPEIIRVLHYFVPDTEASSRSAEGSGRREILFAGRIMPEKGLDDLVRALAAVKTECRLVVVGDGPGLCSAEKLVRRLKLQSRVEFAGWQEDVEPFYARASLLVVPSLWPEPFGIVGIEAMARALPVVAYRSGGIPEWLDDGVTGLLVEPGNIKGLAGAIDAVLSDPERARNMGRAGGERQRKLFSPQPHLERLEAIYREAIAAFNSR